MMRQGIGTLVVAAFVIGSALVVGCEKKVTSSSEAIQHAQALKTPQEQANYLIAQAQAFLNSKRYQDAVQTAQYVLSQIDSNSQAAKDLLEKAKTQLASEAQGAVGDAKKQLGL